MKNNVQEVASNCRSSLYVEKAKPLCMVIPNL